VIHKSTVFEIAREAKEADKKKEEAEQAELDSAA